MRSLARGAMRLLAALVAALSIFTQGGIALAANPAPVQLFYMPFPEDQLLTGLQAIENGGPSNAPTNPVTPSIPTAPPAHGADTYYDQWEKGRSPIHH